MVAAPGEYRWSSHAANAFGAHDPLLRPHPAYLALGADSPSRQQAYRALVAETLVAEELELIRLRLQRQHALGSDRFRACIEAQLARRAGPARIGRPRKTGVAISGI